MYSGDKAVGCGRRGELGGLRCLFPSEVGTLVQVAVSKIRMVQVPRDEARRVLRMRWSRKSEVTDFKVDRIVVWRCVQVKNYSFFHFHSNIIHCDNVTLFCTDCTVRRWQLGPSMTVEVVWRLQQDTG